MIAMPVRVVDARALCCARELGSGELRPGPLDTSTILVLYTECSKLHRTSGRGRLQ